MSLKRAKRGRKGFKGAIAEEVAGTVHGIPQYASLFHPVADVASPTSSVPIFSANANGFLHALPWQPNWPKGGFSPPIYDEFCAFS